MPIRQRISANPTPVIEPEEEVEELRTEIGPVDDVPRIMRATEDRGEFKFGQDPYDGCTYDQLGISGDLARPIVARDAFVNTPPLPKEMSVQDLLANLRMMNNPGDAVELTYRRRTRSPLTAIRGFCVDCSGGSPRAATNCSVVECPFWAFRKGQNGYRGSR